MFKHIVKEPEGNTHLIQQLKPTIGITYVIAGSLLHRHLQRASYDTVTHLAKLMRVNLVSKVQYPSLSPAEK